MKTPQFWKTRNRKALALWPLSMVYETLSTLKRTYTMPLRLEVPVVCIGNVTAGGSGKTPVALHVGRCLKEKNIAAFFISRGYGGSAHGPLLVNPDKHRSEQVGDEPLLLAQVLPTVVGKDRVKAAQFAIRRGAKLLIFDDGFQNNRIYKNFSFLVLDGTIGVGNGMLLPAGPLRERLDVALKRAHAVVMINPMAGSITLPKDKPVLYARTKVVGIAERLRNQRVVAFCGIAYPEKFKKTVTELGANILEFEGFPDHCPYPLSRLMPLVEKASKEKAYLVTTAKDAVRLPAILKDKVIVVDQELIFSQPELLNVFIDYVADMA